MKPPRLPLVVFNAHLVSSTASYRSAGISAYIVNLLQSLSGQERALRYEVLLGPDGRLPADVSIPLHRSSLKTHRPFVRIFWEQVGLPVLLGRMGADLLHAPAFVGPLLTACPQVITVHDLSFLRYPEFFRKGNRFYLSLMTKLACRRAAGVIAVSKFTAQEVVSLLGVPAEKVHPIYNGVDSRFHPLPLEAVSRFRTQEKLPERFVLYLGTLEPRKNLLAVVRAFSRLHDPSLHLVLAGGKGWLYEDIFAEVERLGLEDRIHFPGYVPAETQVLWYNAASAFVYLSHYEGFGLPVLEALACGVPTLCANTASLPEVVGEAALTANPTEVDAVAERLQQLLTDEVLRHGLQQSGPKRAAHFNWENTAFQTAALYHAILGQ